MKVVILCGGRGTRLEQETEWRPKPMVEIGGKPILIHIMKIYAAFGYRDFVLCLGYKGDVIRNYFLNFPTNNNDFTVNLKTGNVFKYRDENPDWNVTLVNTGEESQTGARVKKIEKFIDEDTFMLTYGDAVADIDIAKLAKFHHKHKKIATVTGVTPSYKSRFGEIRLKGEKVVRFTEKPVVDCSALTSGGFFVLNRKIFKYLSSNDSCVFETDPIEKLAKGGELYLFKHRGFWHCMDTPRDMIFLNKIARQAKFPWIHDKSGKRPSKKSKPIFDMQY